MEFLITYNSRSCTLKKGITAESFGTLKIEQNAAVLYKRHLLSVYLAFIELFTARTRG